MSGRVPYAERLSRERVRRVVRSALFRAPGLYDYVAVRRVLWMDKVGRVHDRDLLALPSLFPDPRPLVVDVGANCGQTVLSVKRLLPDARVVSFEPDPDSLRILQRLQHRFPDLRIEGVGLGDRNEVAEFYIPVYNERVMSGLSSFDYRSAQSWLNEGTVLGFRPELLEIRVGRAPIRRLDDYNLDPDLIKIDAQGFEDQVVRGGMETIGRARPVLFVENPSGDLASVLGSLGYRAFECRSKQLVPTSGTSTNQYFLPTREDGHPVRRSSGR